MPIGSLSMKAVKGDLIRWAVWRIDSSAGVPIMMVDESPVHDLNDALKQPLKEGQTPIIFAAEVKYMSRQEMQKLNDESQRRMVSNPRKGLKEFAQDSNLAERLVLREVMKAWYLTVAGMRQMRAVFDLNDLPDTETVEFNQENLDLMVDKSNLASVINNLINQYEWWFPNSENAEKNSLTGLASSGPKPVVSPA